MSRAKAKLKKARKRERRMQAKQANASSITLPRDKLGYPGISGELILVAGQVTAPETLDLKQDSTVRPFKVGLILTKTGDIGEPTRTLWNETGGGSHITFMKMPGETSSWYTVQTREVEYTVDKNQRGEVAMIRATVNATNIPEANSKFIDNIAPMLDFFAYVANCPVMIQKRFCEDTKNNMVMMSFTPPYPDMTLNSHQTSIEKELIPIFALFREAKNSNSHYYKFFCYCKIMEGIFTHVRPNRMKQAKSANVALTVTKERVPDHPELRLYSKEHIGKPIQQLYMDHLQIKYRHALAHFTLDGGDPLIISKNETTAEFSNQVLLAELCCREIIENERKGFAELQQLTQSRTPQGNP
jgi:hypothetical protein